MSALFEAARPVERTVSVGGCQIWYRQAGEGRPLFHLHGAGGPSWDEAHRLLAERFRVIAPALPGFGASPLDYRLDSLSSLAHLLASFIREVAAGKAHILGSSFGGRAATWLALEQPGVIDRLGLESPANFRPPDAPPPDGGPTQDLMDEETRRKNGTAIAQLTKNSTGDVQDRLGEIQVPTLALFGTEDRLIPPETGRIYKDRMPDCNFVIVYQAGHIIRRDRPQAFAHLVADFLDRGPAFLVNRGRAPKWAYG